MRLPSLSLSLLSALGGMERAAAGAVMSVEYFENALCGLDGGADLFGMQVSTNQCFRQVGSQGSGSAVVSCTTAGLVVNEYAGSLNCSTGVTSTVTLATGFNSASCLSSSFIYNEYFPTFIGNSIKINCDAVEEWYNADEGRYELSRQTTSLESISAADYTLDNCLENNAITEMDFCYLNANGEVCLPTNSDADDDSFCSDNALTTYAYSTACIYDPYNSYYVQYRSDNKKAGYMNKDCTNSFDDDKSFVVPFSDCLRCNRFKDLKDDSVDTSALVAIIIGIIIGVLILCVCCGCAVFAALYGCAALCGLIFCSKKSNSSGAIVETANFNSTCNTPLHDSNYSSQSHYPYPGQQAAYVQGSPHPILEVIHVQIPPGGTPGMAMMVTKSTGQQVQVVIPEGMQPGQIMEVKA